MLWLLGKEQVWPSQEMRQHHCTMAGKHTGGLENSIHTVIIKISNYQSWPFRAKSPVQRQATPMLNDASSLPEAPPPLGRLLPAPPALTAGVQREAQKHLYFWGPAARGPDPWLGQHTGIHTSAPLRSAQCIRAWC